MAVEGILGAAALMESLSSIEETLDHGDSHYELETNSQTESELIDDTELQDKTNLSEAKIDSLAATVVEIRDKVSQLKRQLDSKDAKFDDITSELTKLQQRVTDIEVELKEKDGHIKSLQKEVIKLQEDLRNLQKDYDQLYISQAACYFEQAICSYVLPEVFKKDFFATIKKLMNYLSGKKNLPFRTSKSESKDILRQAKPRWEMVCRHLTLPDEWKEKSGDWDHDSTDVPDTIRAIGYLKERRIPIAHPSPIKVGLAKKKVESDLIKASMPEWQYCLVKEFFDSLGANIRKIGVSHEELLLS